MARSVARQIEVIFYENILFSCYDQNQIMAPSYNIASIPGDGIGPEVVSAAIQVVEKLAKTLGTFQIEFTHIPWGTAYYKETGRYVSEDALDTLRKFDAGIFGAVGAPGKLYHHTSPVVDFC